MGACNFLDYAAGRDAREAFDNAVNEAVFRYGHDAYNGTIATTDLSRRAPKVLRKRYTKTADALALREAKEDGWGRKWEARALDLGACGRGRHMYAFYGLAAC